MEQIVIKHNDNTQMAFPNYGASAVVTSATITEEHQGAHTLAITVESATPIDFTIGDTITVLGVTYTLLQLPQTQKQRERSFVYNATFEAPQYRLIDVQFLLPVDSKNTSLTGNFETFLDILIDNANRASIPPISWRKGTISMPTIAEDETDTKTIDYADTNCLSVLQDMCKQWGVEYQLVQDGTECVINIAPTIGATFPHTFQYGRGRGLYEIERINADSKDIITRLYVYGSHENLPLNYRASKLCLPASTGRNDSFVEDAEMREMYGLREGVQSFPDIKPQRVGAITSVNGLKSFVDTSMDFDLNEKMSAGSTKYLIDGTTAQIVFKTGNLAGYAFDISTYDHDTKTFNINSYTDENDYQFPNPESSAFQFGVGDRYIITGIRVPQSYIDTAEAKLLTEAQKYLDENAQPQVNYNLVLDPAYIGNLYPDMHVRVFRAGDYVRVADADVAPDEIATRITAVSINLMNNNDYSLTLGDSVQVSTIARMVSAIKSVQEVIVANDIDTTPAFQRRWRATEELRNMVFDPEGDYYSDKIKPMSIETTMLSVGARSQQYTLVNVRFKTNPILSGATAQDFNALVVNGGSLNHYTINADGTIRTWQIADATVTDLTPAQAYYIFAKCARVDNGATIVVDAQNHIFDEDPSFYFFLIGTLSSSDAETGRMLSLTYGSTTINGEHVQTGVIKSNNGRMQIDLNNATITTDANGLKIGTSTVEKYVEDEAKNAVSNIEIGSRNYIPNSARIEQSPRGESYYDARVNMSSALRDNPNWNKNVILSFDAHPETALNDDLSAQIYFSASSYPVIGTFRYPSHTTEKKHYTFKKNFNGGSWDWASPQFFVRYVRVTCNMILENVQYLVGDTETDWMPAIEDTQEALADAEAKANEANDNIAKINDDGWFSLDEKIAVRKEWQAIWGASNTLLTGYGREGSAYKVYLSANNLSLNWSTCWSSAESLCTFLSSIDLYGVTPTLLSTGQRDELSWRFRDYYNLETALWDTISKKVASNAEANSKSYTDALRLGSRNYVLNSKSYTIAHNVTTSYVDYVFNLSADFLKQNWNSKVVLSFDAKMRTATSANVTMPIYHRMTGFPMYGNLSYPSDSTLARHYVFTLDLTGASGSNSNQIFIRATQSFAFTLDLENIHLTLSDKEMEWQPAPEDAQNAITLLQTNTEQMFRDLEAQMDGEIETWADRDSDPIDYVPTLSNYPANSWNTATLKKEHCGDLFYNTKNGKVYRFVVNSGVYSWKWLENDPSAQALVTAQEALKKAGDKSAVIYGHQPIPPYEIGDMWVQGGNQPILVCKTSRASGSFVSSDWEDATNFISQEEWQNVATKANKVDALAFLQKAFAESQNGETQIIGGLTLGEMMATKDRTSGKVTAMMNGSATSSDSVAFAAGRDVLGEDSPFKVMHNGHAEMSDVEIRSGALAQAFIQLINGNINLGYGDSVNTIIDGAGGGSIDNMLTNCNTGGMSTSVAPSYSNTWENNYYIGSITAFRAQVSTADKGTLTIPQVTIRLAVSVTGPCNPKCSYTIKCAGQTLANGTVASTTQGGSASQNITVPGKTVAMTGSVAFYEVVISPVASDATIGSNFTISTTITTVTGGTVVFAKASYNNHIYNDGLFMSRASNHYLGINGQTANSALLRGVLGGVGFEIGTDALKSLTPSGNWVPMYRLLFYGHISLGSTKTLTSDINNMHKTNPPTMAFSSNTYTINFPVTLPHSNPIVQFVQNCTENGYIGIVKTVGNNSMSFVVMRNTGYVGSGTIYVAIYG